MLRTASRLAAALGLFAFMSGAHAALINSYDFDGDLSDTLGNGVNLVASGGTVGGGVYSFGLNQGLRLSSALTDTSAYAIEMRVQASDSVGGYNKLIDFQDLASDLGFYILNGTLDFYTVGPTAGSLLTNTFYTIGLARAGGILSAYLDGTQVWSAVDGTGQAVSAANILNFFEDDFATNQSEAFTGSVDWIRIHNDVSSFGTAPQTGSVPEPATLALAGIALVGSAWRRRKSA